MCVELVVVVVDGCEVVEWVEVLWIWIEFCELYVCCVNCGWFELGIGMIGCCEIEWYVGDCDVDVVEYV